MKKYYFESRSRISIYVLMMLFFTAILIFAVIAKDTTSQESTVIVVSFCSVINSVLLFWVCFSFSMRIQIDYDKRELYIRHTHLIKRIKFLPIHFLSVYAHLFVAHCGVVPLRS